MLEVNPFGEDVLCKVARTERQTGSAHFVHALLRQKADLAVPVARVRVTDDAWFSFTVIRSTGCFFVPLCSLIQTAATFDIVPPIR